MWLRGPVTISRSVYPCCCASLRWVLLPSSVPDREPDREPEASVMSGTRDAALTPWLVMSASTAPQVW